MEDETVESNIEHNNIKNIESFDTTTKASTSSIRETNLSATDEDKICGNKMEPNEEDEKFSSVSMNVYLSYFSAGGNICKISFFFFAFILTQALATGGDYWISYWYHFTILS